MTTRQRPPQIISVLAVLMSAGLCLWLLSACAPLAPSIPAPEQFTQPAIGVPLPRVTSVQLKVTDDKGGVVFYNQKLTPIRVAITDTITTITPTQGFAFVVSPGAYTFYIYETDGPASIRTEQVEAGKVRYVYILPLTMQVK